MSVQLVHGGLSGKYGAASLGTLRSPAAVVTSIALSLQLVLSSGGLAILLAGGVGGGVGGGGEGGGVGIGGCACEGAPRAVSAKAPRN